MAESLQSVFHRKFGASTCFLCGCRLGKKNRSEEHIFSKWVQRRHSLVNEKLILLNGTEIPYRQLTVPCCGLCNTKYLQPVETAMSKAVANGPNAVSALHYGTIFIWLGKIYYGILYKEMFLRLDRAARVKTGITNRALLDRLATHHLFLQSVRTPLKFQNFLPASIFIFETLEAETPRDSWDFSDDLNTTFIACRMGRVGIIGVLQDASAQQNLLRQVLGGAIPRKLHPVQFREVMARVRYQSMLLNRTPKYLTIADDRQPVVHLMPLQGFSKKPIFDDWDQRKYAQVLAAVTGSSFEALFREPDLVWSWLKTADGKPNRMK